MRQTQIFPLCLSLLASASLLLGCSGSGARLQKSSASALWISAGSAELTTSTASRLKDAGIIEAFVPAAKLDTSNPAQPLRRLEVAEIGTGLPATLAIGGSFPLSGEEEVEALAEKVAEQARQLRFDIESQGLLVVGVHFDLRDVRDLSAYGAFLRRINRSMDKDIYLSASVERGWVEKEQLEAVTGAVDFVVAFLYGQRIDEPEASDAWDFVQLEKRLQRLEELGTPYLVGAITLGYASHVDSSGLLKARATRRSLLEIISNPNLKLRPGFTLEGVNRRVYALNAERATKVGDWDVPAGDGIRVVRPASSDIEELLRLLDLWQLPGHLGVLYFELPGEGELLSMHSDSLLSALAPTPASPDLVFDVTVQRRSGRGWLLRFGLTNSNREFTELSTLESNYLQVILPEARFTSSRVETGDFHRYDLLRLEDGDMEPTFRQANVLRLYVPILEGQQRVNSGDIEVVGRGEPLLELSASFLLPDGRTLELGPRRWRGGSFVDEP